MSTLRGLSDLFAGTKSEADRAEAEAERFVPPEIVKPVVSEVAPKPVKPIRVPVVKEALLREAVSEALVAQPTVRGGGVVRKTSLAIPVELVTRLKLAKTQARWSFPDLLRDGVTRCNQLPVNEAEALLREYAGAVLVARATQVESSLVDALDELALRWRMSRSQVVSVVLAVALTAVDASRSVS
jgi:hypothetical protein